METHRSRNKGNIRNSGSDSDSQTATKPNKWFLLVGISFGLLCMVQASLNIYLRLYNDVDRCNNVTTERDELQKKRAPLNMNEVEERGMRRGRTGRPAGERGSCGRCDLPLYTLHRVLEGSWEFAQPVHMCFVDLEKAFDRVPRGVVWGVLREYGVRGSLPRAVRSLYERSKSCVRIAVNDVVLMASSNQDLQHALGRFAAECEATGMKISSSKSEAMVLDRKKVPCPLQVGGESLPQVEEYLGVLFKSEGRMEREIDRRIGAASAVMRSLYRTVVVKKELSRKAKLSIYRSIYVPTLTYGHELWVMTERTRSQIQAVEMSFLRRVAGRSLRDRVRSSVTREELGVEPLLLHVERSQLRWLGHLFRMPPGRLPREVFRPCPTGRRPRGRPRTRWRDYVSRLAWVRLGIPPEELEEVCGDSEVWASLLRLLPPRPDSG
ncbi:hypothetical protein WMY93_008149 [Mugilogobius chulae]|uniref:Reverse transcriptase domain-containing protein n=1 Tax=Mugilogobius chulae TaxID=88201 RepID=A0AAW0PLL4_9GOBI